jgi:hypothetical protein
VHRTPCAGWTRGRHVGCSCWWVWRRSGHDALAIRGHRRVRRASVVIGLLDVIHELPARLYRGRPLVELVLSDGRRFGCPARFGRGPTQVSVIEHAKACIPLARLVISAESRAVGARIGRARACLIAHGLKVVGGLVLPPQDHGGPAGELDTAAALIAFYTGPGQASRAEPAIVKNARRVDGQVERAGAANIAWLAPPPPQLRDIVQTCAAR